ncbi:MAG: DEAD/DEAH box helicase [Desulfobacterales bacterium]|nr:DEAD/DEAH box helicase [Desulfobacterales bacterium]
MAYPKSKTLPWLHQEQAWDFIEPLPSAYLAMDMGTGKTKTAIDSCVGHDDQIVFIICPHKVISVWPRQFDLHCAKTYKVLALDSGTVAKKADIINNEVDAAVRFGRRLAIVTNYESFWRSPLGPTYNKKNRIIKKGLLLTLPIDKFIPDEAHRLKSPSGRASWGAMRVAAHAKRRLFLSGTPMPSSPKDIYAQFRALDSSIFGTSLMVFMSRYAVMGGYEGRQVLRWINQEELNQKFYSIAFRVKTDDVLNLPAVNHDDIICELAPATMKIYRELENEFIAQVGTGEVTVGNALTKLLRLSQFAGGFATLDNSNGKTEKLDPIKVETMIEKIDDLGPVEPVVIFYRFKPEVAEIRVQLEKIGRTVGEISGSYNDEPAWIDKRINTVCVQIKTGGEGLDSLTRARYGFFYSKGMLSVGQLDQAVRRLSRPGQTRKTFFYHVLAKGTVDMKVERGLKTGRNIIEAVMEDMTGVDPFGVIPRKAA